jgi:hypothetical protein
MVAATDWSRALARGSYKGAPFHFESDGREGGRRLVVHEFPGAETPIIEDMGRRAQRYTLAVYVTDRWAANRLWAACNSRGSGILVSPLHGTIIARCEEIAEAHQRDKMGYLAFDVTFVQEGMGASTFSSVDDASHLLGRLDSVVGALPAAIRAILKRDDQAPLLEDLATQALRFNVERVRDAVQTVALPTIVGRDLLASLNTAWTLSRNPRAGTVGAFRAIGAALRAVVVETDPDVSLVVARSLTELPALGVEPLSLTRRDARRFRRATDLGVAAAAVAVAIRQEALSPWPSRQDAVLARDRIRAAFDAIGEEVGEVLGEGPYRQLLVLRNDGINRLTTRITDLAPVVGVDMGTSRSAIRVAYDLYGGPGPARSIVRRNNVSTPALMPTRLEVIQP